MEIFVATGMDGDEEPNEQIEVVERKTTTTASLVSELKNILWLNTRLIA